MDPRRPAFGLSLLLAASLAFVAVSLYAGLGTLSVIGCMLMAAGFAAAMRSQDRPWLGVSSGAAVAIGGFLFFVDNFLPFSLGSSSLAILVFVAGGIALGAGYKLGPAWINAAGGPFLVAGLLWIIADLQSEAPEWQLGNALVLLGGLMLLLGLRRRRPPRPTPVEKPARSVAATPARA